MTRREGLLGRVLANAGLWLLLAALVDHAASASGARFDLTDDRRHTLAPVTRSTAASLERTVTATAFFTADLDAPYHQHRATTLALLDEIAAASQGRLIVRIVDPVGPGAEEAKARGVLPVEYRLQTDDRSERKAVYLGVAISSGDREAVITPIASLQTLEYDVVRALRRVSAEGDDRRTVGWLTGNGAPDLLRARTDSALGGLRTSLQGDHEVISVGLAEGLAVPDEVDALLVVGPNRPLTEHAIYALDQFVLRGGALGVFVTTARPDVDAMTIKPADGGLHELAAHLGVRIEPGLAVDRAQHDVLTITVPAGARRAQVSTPHPLMPVVTDLSPQSPIHRGLQRLTVPFAAPLSVVEPLPPGVESTVLITSSSASSAVTGLTSLRPDVFAQALPGERAGPFPLGVALVGRWPSLFTSRPVPGDGAGQVFHGVDARVLVVASSDFVANEPMWVTNAVDWLLADPALVQIRSRELGPSPLAPLDDAARLRWKIGLTAAPLLALGLLALVAAVRR